MNRQPISTRKHSRPETAPNGAGPPTPPPSTQLPYLTDPDYSLDVLGRWEEGGVVQIFYRGDSQKVVDLPPAEWSVLAALVEAAHWADCSNWSSAFLSPRHLARQLDKRTTLLSPGPENVIKFVYKLRRLLDNIHPPSISNGSSRDCESWGKNLIEHRRFLGYRVSLPSPQLRLHIIEEGTRDER